MYSHEIEQLLLIKQNILTVSDYFYILNTSQQINYIKYNPETDEETLKTDDKYEFKFKVKTKNY